MSFTRTIMNPGVELSEVDMSQYTATTIDTYRVLMAGFSSAGPVATPTTITSMSEFSSTFGKPTNEAERYSYNAADNILGAGGELVFGRISYDGGVKYPTVTYKATTSDITGDDADANLSTLLSGITTLSNAVNLTLSSTTAQSAIPQSATSGELQIVDIATNKYASYNANGSQVSCLGIMPVVTTPVNALAVQQLINGSYDAIASDGSASYLTSATSAEQLAPTLWKTPLGTEDDKDSIAKSAASNFPAITWQTDPNGNQVLDQSYFNYVGIVVYKLGVDAATGLLTVTPLESFVGSLQAGAVDPYTNASVFIDDIVNTSSSNIRVFSNITDCGANTIVAASTDVAILGNVANTSGDVITSEKINEDLVTILDSQSNILGTIIDVVCDGGLSTIASMIDKGNNGSTFDSGKTINNDDWTDAYTTWRGIINKYKNFCETTRKDCVFIADSPRFFSLNGRNKRTNKEVQPLIKNISGIDTSYGWGYAVWYKIADAYSSVSFWMPPSSFGAAAYIKTRRNYNAWSAPAGMTRGVISVADTSFEPDMQTRNALYSNSWNYSLTYVNQGTVLEGQKTYQVKTSAFDRINVRSLFLYLERRVYNTARNYIYEPNTAYVRNQFKDTVTPMFETIKNAGGMYDYKIIVDETINTDDVIDNNEFRAVFLIKPTKLIEFIQLQFVATRIGANFDEIAL